MAAVTWPPVDVARHDVEPARQSLDDLAYDDPDALHRRDRGRQLRTSGNADRDRAGHVHALAAVPALRPCRSDLAEPRPLRAVRRSRLGPPLVAAAPDGRPRRRPEYEILGEPAVALDDLRRFRQLGSKCPGHPEYRWTSGVETTTARSARASPPRSGWRSRASGSAPATTATASPLFDFDVYAQAGDGCMMEGVASEARRTPRTSGCRTSAGSTTRTGSRSRATPTSRSPRTSPRGSSRTAGTSTTVADANDLEAGRARVPGVPRRGRATDARRRPQPHRLRDAGRGHAEGARRAARARRA